MYIKEWQSKRIQIEEYINETKKLENIKNRQHLSRILNGNMGIKSEKEYEEIIGKRSKMYVFDRELINKSKEEYNIDSE